MDKVPSFHNHTLSFTISVDMLKHDGFTHFVVDPSVPLAPCPIKIGDAEGTLHLNGSPIYAMNRDEGAVVEFDCTLEISPDTTFKDILKAFYGEAPFAPRT